MLLATVGMLNQENVARIGILGSSATWSPRLEGQTDARNVRDVIMTRGLNHFTSMVRFAFICNDYSEFIINGADVMDGKYQVEASLARFRLLEIARRAGLRTGVLGLSVNDHPPSLVRKAFRRSAPSIVWVTRDPVSNRRLTEHLGRDTPSTADLAFLVRPRLISHQAEDAGRWLDERARPQRVSIGINLNHHTVKGLEGDSETRLCTSFARAVQSLLEDQDNFDVLFIPHDFRGGESSDLHLIRRVETQLPSALGGRTRVVEPPFGASDVRALVEKLDVVVSGRMHLAIASVERQVPAICVSYQGKLEGLFEITGLPRSLLLSPYEALSPTTICDRIRWTLDHRRELADALCRRLPEIRSQAEHSFLHYRREGFSRG